MLSRNRGRKSGRQKAVSTPSLTPRHMAPEPLERRLLMTASVHYYNQGFWAGAPFTAGTAQELGIVNTVVGSNELLNMATEKARQLAERPPAALRITKALLKRGSANAIAEAMAKETEQFAALLQGPEAKEAMMAFMQRRKPDFSQF